MHQKKRLILSMFHRRLILLLWSVSLVLGVLWLQLVRLSVVEGAERRRDAERVLERRTYLPSPRARILDRHGRVLAMDKATYSVAVPYQIITDVWAEKQARRQARKEIGTTRWRQMTEEQRSAAAADRISEWQWRCDRLWSAICVLGEIDQMELDRRLNDIKRRVQIMAAEVWHEQREQRRRELGKKPGEPIDFRQQPIREQVAAHVILPAVPDEVAYDFRELAEALPGMVEVQDSIRREYPWQEGQTVQVDRTSFPLPIRSSQPMTIRLSGVADHILGYVRRKVYRSDLERRPFVDPRTGEIDLKGYRSHDVVGARGIERVFEDQLRGTRGYVKEQHGRGSTDRVSPAAGSDVQLTLDVRLQARVQAIMTPELGLARVQPWQKNPRLPIGTPLNGAVVVLEVQTGEILAMVSMPTLAIGRHQSAATVRPDQSWVNRAVEAVYPPGSIVKPLVLAAAAADGAHDLDEPIECTGHFFPHLPDQMRCWIYREQYGFATHGPLLVEEAIARSCNIYFYTLADRLGLGRLTEWYRAFGLGRPLDVGLMARVDGPGADGQWIGEQGGHLPTDQEIARLGVAARRSRAIMMGIGQGPITWTPVQAANAYATLARNGARRDGTLIAHESRPAREDRRDLHLEPAVIDRILEGLRQSIVEPYGSSSHLSYFVGTSEPIINATGVTVWGKTGTAQAPPLRVQDTNGDGRIDSKDEGIAGLDHAWFVGLVGDAGATRPAYAISVVVEYGGSGGRTAGPIANQVIRALQAEGYLQGGAPPTS